MNWTFFSLILFCQSKTKQFSYQTVFASEHLFILKQTIHLAADVQETKENEGPAAPISPASFFQNCQWWGHFWDLSSRLRSQLCLKGFQFASPVKWASHCALPFSLTLDSWCFSIYKNVFQSCKYRGNTYWDFFFTLMVNALCWGERITVQINAGSIEHSSPMFCLTTLITGHWKSRRDIICPSGKIRLLLNSPNICSWKYLANLIQVHVWNDVLANFLFVLLVNLNPILLYCCARTIIYKESFKN